jgi:hypothetical protein
MWRRSPRTEQKPAAQQSPYRAQRLSESLAIGLGCDRTPPGSGRRTRAAGSDRDGADNHELRRD